MTSSPSSSTARGAETRARAAAATDAALAILAASSVPRDVLADVAALLIGDWTAAAYGPARELLAGIAAAPAPVVEPGTARLAAARRLHLALLDAGPSAATVEQLAAVIRDLRRAWLGRDAETPERTLLRSSARIAQERLAALRAA